MLIDLSELLKKKITKKSLSLTFPMDSFSEKGEVIEFSKPVELSCTLSMVNDIINFDGNISTELKLSCSRCLENFYQEIHIELHELFSTNRDNRDDDIIFIDSDSIDITQIIQNGIVAALPIKLLCSDDCKGLCQNCGVNLNFSACKCEKNDIDPRLAKLKDMFFAD